jgi:hypothetical protein
VRKVEATDLNDKPDMFGDAGPPMDKLIDAVLSRGQMGPLDLAEQHMRLRGPLSVVAVTGSGRTLTLHTDNVVWVNTATSSPLSSREMARTVSSRAPPSFAIPASDTGSGGTSSGALADEGFSRLAMPV